MTNSAEMTGSAPASATQGISDIARVHYSLCNIMKRMSNSDDPADVQQAYVECEQMLREPDLPLVDKVRCYILLSSQTNEDDTQHTHAIEHIDTAIQKLEHVRPMTREGGAYPQETYANALKLRSLLIKDKAELAELRAVEAEEAVEARVIDSEEIPDDPVQRQ
jgi:hypothetical protein